VFSRLSFSLIGISELKTFFSPSPSHRGKSDKSLVNLRRPDNSKLAAFSTVITEALVLGKLAVTLNLTAEGPAPYFREVTLRVDRKGDLIPAIAKALHDENTRERLKKTAKNFAFNHTYKQDAKATERVISLIKRMIKKETVRWKS